MFQQIFESLDYLNILLWGYLGVGLILLSGLYFSIQARFVQFFRFPSILKTFYNLTSGLSRKSDSPGVHPIKTFFASIGGCIGTGNVVSICLAIQLGGPGALFWIWVTAFFGMVIKYAEVYVGIRYRVRNQSNSYDGGPMYYMQRAFKSSWPAWVATILLCIYGVEIHIFDVVVDSITYNWGWNRAFAVLTLLVFCLLAARGGIERVGKICGTFIPLFVVLFMGMSGWVLSQNLNELPNIFFTIINSAFSGHAAIGGFAGSSLLIAVAQGAKQGCYSGDIGIGYASIINSETSMSNPKKQASLAIFGIFLDSFVICTLSVSLILLTGAWTEALPPETLIQISLAQYFPHMDLFMPFFVFLLGYSTLITYFVVGLKCARFLHPKYGPTCYYIYATFAWIFFSNFNSAQAFIIMNIAGGLLLVLNTIALFRLRKQIDFDI